jgi:hypothetical protein
MDGVGDADVIAAATDIPSPVLPLVPHNWCEGESHPRRNGRL